ncbi:MAG: SH3 domain-containing protein [Christensenellales bacterium]|jgi:uncharacterized protein YgiM (DUF1202 family)
MKRRLLWAVLLILIASALTAPVALAEEQCELGRVTASDFLNMRAKASTDCKVIAKIPGGSSVIVLGSTGQFFKVKYDGKVGYISDDYAVKLKHWVGYATEDLNLRASPSTSSRKLGTINKGDSLYIYASNGDFYLAVYGDTKCYVAKKYITKKKRSVNPVNDYNEFDPESNEYYIENPLEFTDQDLYLAAQLIYSEGNSQSDVSFWAMASVVYNRVASDKFPHTVYEVAFQKNQFSYPDKYPEKFLQLSPSVEALEAVIKVFIEGKLILPPDVMYFKSSSLPREWGRRDYYCTVGGNMYYR